MTSITTTNVSVTSITATNVTLRWSHGSDVIDYYYLKIGESSLEVGRLFLRNVLVNIDIEERMTTSFLKQQNAPVLASWPRHLTSIIQLF